MVCEGQKIYLNLVYLDKLEVPNPYGLYTCTLGHNLKNRPMRKINVLILILILLPLRLMSQDRVSVLKEFKNIDLSCLWIYDSTESIQDLITQNGKDVIVYGKCVHSEPLGFIGENYQRLYIHFDNVKQDKKKPLEYYVFGKSKVDINICSFEGKLKISEAYKNNILDVYDTDFITGTIKGEFEFYENKNQIASGLFKGEFYSNWCKNIKTNIIEYNALDAVSDRFCNNGFTGIWTSYKTNSKKKCSWGDSRIPDSGDLDTGEGEFYVNEKYIKFGWDSYYKAWNGKQDTQESLDSRSIEYQQWWNTKK